MKQNLLWHPLHICPHTLKALQYTFKSSETPLDVPLAT